MEIIFFKVFKYYNWFKRIMNRVVIAGSIFLMLLIVSGASGCTKGTTGTGDVPENCMPGHVQSICSNGEVMCCMDGWVCCADGGVNDCTPESFCEGNIPSDPFAGT